MSPYPCVGKRGITPSLPTLLFAPLAHAFFYEAI